MRKRGKKKPKGRSLRFCLCNISDLAGNNVLGLFVEQVDSVHVKSDLNGVAMASLAAGVNAGSEVELLVGEVEVGNGTKLLDNVDFAGDNRCAFLLDIGGIVADALRTDAADDGLVGVGKNFGVAALFVGQPELVLTELDVGVAAFVEEDGIEDVHLGSADKGSDEEVGGIFVKNLGSCDLLDDTVLHADDTSTHGHSLDLVVGNVDKGGSELLMELGELGSHLSTELSVKVGERLVEEEDLGVTDDGTAESDTLLLTAGESLGLSVEQVSNVEDLSCFFDAALDLFLGSLAKLQTECHVLKHGHMRIQSVVLEHHRDIAILRSNVVDQTVTDEKLTLGDLLKACNHTQSRGLTATGRTNEYQEFLVLDFKAEIGYGGNAAGVLLVNVLE